MAAYREALKERTRDRVPRDWAMTKTNLGTALGRLGARENRTARLEEAVAAYLIGRTGWLVALRNRLDTGTARA